MHRQRPLCTTLFLALALLGLFGTNRAQADFITYQVTVDTSAIRTHSGYLDFQFNPGPGAAASATAAITNFLTDGSLNPNDPNSMPSGDVTGSLTSPPLTLTNDTAYNDFFEGFTYGKSISFDVTFSGAGISNSGSLASAVGSSFAFSLYNSDMVTPSLQTTDLNNNSVVTINVNGDGTTSPEIFTQLASAGPPVSSVPMPPSIVLLLSAVPVGFLYWRRSR